MGLALVAVMTIIQHPFHNGGWVLAYAVALLMGLSGSFCSNVRSTIYAEYHGRKHLGAVQSLASSHTVFGSAVEPFTFDSARDMTGSFTLPFGVASVFPLLATLLVFGKRQPRPMEADNNSVERNSSDKPKGHGSK